MVNINIGSVISIGYQHQAKSQVPWSSKLEIYIDVFMKFWKILEDHLTFISHLYWASDVKAALGTLNKQ